MSGASATRGRRGLVIGLTVVFAAPLLIALILRVSGWQPSVTGNHGELVEPPVPLDVPKSSDLADHWVLVFSPASSCDAQCRSVDESLHGVHRALGKDAHRVRLVWSQAPAEQGTAPERTIDGAAWLTRLERAAPGGLQPNAAYLVDPRGFLMMWYPPGFEAPGVLEDLERLLRYSRVGVQ